MKKKLTLGLLMVLFAGIAVAAPLQNFEYGGVAGEAFDGFSLDVTGGETLEGNVSFENRLNRDLPLLFEVSVSSDKGMVGPEFDLDASLTESGGMLDCRSVKVSGDTVDYRCFNGSEAEIDSGSNTIYFSSTANTRIAPGIYDVQLAVKSVVGEGETVVENESVPANESVEFEAGASTDVAVNASENASVTVKALDRVSASPPENGSDFVSGVSVDVSNGSEDVRATGTVSFTYEDEALDERDVNVYFYNDSRPSGERWEGLGGTQYTSNNTVVAQVDHFSTYSAWVEPEPPEEDEPNPTFTPGFDPAGGEEVNGTGDDQDSPVDDTEEEPRQDQDDQQQQQQDQDTGEEQDTGPQEERPSQSQAGGPTGLFTAEPGSTALGLLALVVVAVAVLQYLGRIDVRKTGNLLRGLRN